ncbi:hypothetical protein B0H11DRAFT_1924000 [Mycena galericulata]|nr:hypothetical protein B0H11DRAFT_1924000 [Mycena galericulata]
MTRTCTSANTCSDTLHFRLRIDASSALTPTPLAPPFCLPLRRHLDVASPPAPHQPSDCRAPPPRHPRSPPAPRLVNPFTLLACRAELLPAIYPMPSSLAPPTPPASFGGRNFVDVCKLPHRCVRVRDGSGGRWVGGCFDLKNRSREVPMGSRRVESGCARASYCGIEARARIDPRSWLVAVGLRLAPGSSLLRKTVLICLLARAISHRCTRALRWPKVAHASFALTWTRRLRANVPPPISAVVARIVLPRSGSTEELFSPSRPPLPFSRACASATTPALRPPLGAPRIRQPPSHLLVANAASPWFGAPHLQHIHHRLPPPWRRATRRFAAQPSHCKCVGDGKEGREGYGGSPRAQLVGGWEEISPHTTRGAMSSRGGEDDAGRRDARSAHVHFLVGGISQDSTVVASRCSSGTRWGIHIYLLLSSAAYPKTPARRGPGPAGIPRLPARYSRHAVSYVGDALPVRCVPQSQSLSQVGEKLGMDDAAGRRRISQYSLLSPAPHPRLRPPSSRFRITAPHRLPFPLRLPGPLPSATDPTHGYCVSNPESGWGPDGSGGVGGSACGHALARRGVRRREKYGMGRGGMEALARRSGAEPRRTRSEEGRCGVGSSAFLTYAETRGTNDIYIGTDTQLTTGLSSKAVKGWNAMLAQSSVSTQCRPPLCVRRPSRAHAPCTFSAPAYPKPRSAAQRSAGAPSRAPSPEAKRAQHPPRRLFDLVLPIDDEDGVDPSAHRPPASDELGAERSAACVPVLGADGPAVRRVRLPFCHLLCKWDVAGAGPDDWGFPPQTPTAARSSPLAAGGRCAELSPRWGGPLRGAFPSAARD